MEHADAPFAFDLPGNTAVFVCSRVREGAPILRVSRDHDGDWQFLCGGEHGDAELDRPHLVCLEHVVAGDPSLNEVADMCPGWSASRRGRAAGWEWHDGNEDIVRESVETDGWTVIAVTASDHEPAFAYTIGLTRTFGHAELIVFGMLPENLIRVLDLCGELIKGGARLEEGQDVGHVLADRPIRLRAVTREQAYHDHVRYALSFNGGLSFNLMQVLWPDERARFPDDAGCREEIRNSQPLL